MSNFPYDPMAELCSRGLDDEYRRLYPEVKATGIGSFNHYRKYGQKIGRTLDFNQFEASSGRDTMCSGIKVSVVCIAYNQERYIGQALEGFVNQQTNFECEFLIGDDGSSDNTPNIIREYSDRDARIIPVLRKSNLGASRNFWDLAKRARGIYLALCEGDDYWIDSSKLQIQADLLDNRPEIYLCFHPVRVTYEGSKRKPHIFPAEKADYYNAKNLMASNFIGTNSAMYRWAFKEGPPPDYDHNIVPEDWYLHLLHAEKGEVAIVERTMGVYRRHDEGMWASSHDLYAHRRRYASREIALFRRLCRHFGGLLADAYIESQDTIFDQTMSILISEDCWLEMFSLIQANEDCYKRWMLKRRIPLDSVDLSSAESLGSSFRAANKITVIVTTYNHERHIEKCLRSIAAQRGPFDLQLVIGDDCSDDLTGSIAQKVGSELFKDFIYLRPERNEGMQANLKRCLSVSDGQFIAICEGDDYWISNRKLLRQICGLWLNPKSPMCFNWSLLQREGDGSVIPHPDQGQLPDYVFFEDLLALPWTANFSSCMYRSAHVHDVPECYWLEPHAADWLFNLFVCRNGPALFVKELLSTYLVHPKGLWSRLSDHEQNETISITRDRIHQIFGISAPQSKRATVNIRLHDENIPNKHLQCRLETPTNWATLNSVCGSVEFRGWALWSHDCKPTLYCADRNGTREILLDEARPDVTSSQLQQGDSTYYDDHCGFSFSRGLLQGETVDLFFDQGGRRYPWAQITLL